MRKIKSAIQPAGPHIRNQRHDISCFISSCSIASLARSIFLRIYRHVRIQRGCPDPPPPWTITKNIGFLSNIEPDPLKITKLHLPIQHSMLGHHRRASETPFQWRFAGGLLMARLEDPFSPHQTKKIKKIKERCQSCTPF